MVLEQYLSQSAFDQTLYIIFWTAVFVIVLFFLSVVTMVSVWILRYRSILERRIPMGKQAFIVRRNRCRIKNSDVPYIELFGIPFLQKKYYKMPETYAHIAKERTIIGRLRDRFEFVQLSEKDYQPIIVTSQERLESGKRDKLGRKIKVEQLGSIEDSIHEAKWEVVPTNMIIWHFNRNKELLKRYEWKEKWEKWAPTLITGSIFVMNAILLIILWLYYRDASQTTTTLAGQLSSAMEASRTQCAVIS